MKETQHTKGPWKVGEHSGKNWGTNYREIISESAEFAPSFVSLALESDAHRIVKCVNVFDELLETLRQTVSALEAFHNEREEGEGLGYIMMRRARITIAKAEGE